MENLSGKTALVTGGSRGIGKAVAKAMAAEGVKVGLMGRNEELLKAVKEEIERDGGLCAIAAADVAKQDEVEAAVNSIRDQLGNYDILINSAGIASFGNVLEMPADKWEEIVKVNVFGLMYVTRAVLPDLIDKNGGDVINISSTSGLRANAGTSAYAASKFAVMGLSEAILMEVRKHNVRVTAFAPSTVATDMAMKDLKITDGNPEKVLQAEDIAEMIVVQLKLNKRAFVKNLSIWSTNP